MDALMKEIALTIQTMKKIFKIGCFIMLGLSIVIVLWPFGHHPIRHGEDSPTWYLEQ